jgi:hypothetical protein
MIKTGVFEPSTLVSIAKQLVFYLESARGKFGFDIGNVTVASPLEIWRLEESDAETLETAKFIGAWEHLVSFGCGRFGIARSRVHTESEGPVVVMFTAGENADAFGEALGQISKNATRDCTLRLLHLPKHLLRVIWLNNRQDDFCYVYYLPYEVTQLKNRQVYSWQDLRAVLKLETPVVGVTFR